MSTFGPGWQETTVRWLSTNHPEYLRTGVGRPSVDRLARAMLSMSYRGKPASAPGFDWELELKGASAAATSATYKALAEEWSETDHHEMVNWLALGGYSAWKSALTPTTPTETFRVLDMDGNVMEEIVLEGGEENDPTLPPLQAEPAKTASDEELESLMAEAEFKEDTRHGTW